MNRLILFFVLLSIFLLISLVVFFLVMNYIKKDNFSYLQNYKFFNDIFRDNIWVINLDNRKNRLKKCTKMLKKIGINKFKRFSAVNGKTDPVIQKIRTNIKKSLSNGELGCLFSHLDILKNIIKNKAEWSLIFEDDIFIPDYINQDSFNKIFTEIKNNPHFNPDIIFWGTCYNKKYDYSKKIKLNNRNFEIFNGNSHCTHSYSITLNGAKKILNYIENHPNKFKYPIDVHIRDFCYKYKNFGVIIDKINNKSDSPDKSGIIFQDRSLESDIPIKTFN